MSSAFNEPQSDLGLGFHYFIYGWRLMLQRKLLPFVLIPIAINSVLMIALLWFFIGNIVGWADWIVSFMPSWLDWLTIILVPLAVLSLIMLFILPLLPSPILSQHRLMLYWLRKSNYNLPANNSII
ncbi:putative sulfate transport protein CysZ [Actinobacillus equuli]|nr:putative sulfate transport protein CysZ [Actinobacillus equuli]